MGGSGSSSRMSVAGALPPASAFKDRQKERYTCATAPVGSLKWDDEADDAYFAQPHVVMRIERMRELGEKAKQRPGLTKREKKLLAKFYSEDGLRRRARLLDHPEVIHALETIWLAADTDGSHSIEKDEYLVMHRKLVLALDPSTSPKVAFKAAEEDWVKDSEGKPSLDKERFFFCWFELADLWTDNMETESYVTFLRTTMETITRVAPDGVPEWASDKDVIKAHFNERAKGNRDIEDDGNHYPMVLTLWYAEIKKDAIAHAAVRAMREERRQKQKRLEAVMGKRRAAERLAKEGELHKNTLVLQWQAAQEKEEAERLAAMGGSRRASLIGAAARRGSLTGAALLLPGAADDGGSASRRANRRASAPSACGVNAAATAFLASQRGGSGGVVGAGTGRAARAEAARAAATQCRPPRTSPPASPRRSAPPRVHRRRRAARRAAQSALEQRVAVAPPRNSC